LTLSKDESFHKDSITDKYLYDISRIKMITEDEFNRLFKLYREHGCEKSFKRIITSNLRFVISCAKKYRKRYGTNINDLISSGNYGMCKALERFDDTKGVKFISFAVFHIQKEMMNTVEELGNHVRVSVKVIDSIRRNNACNLTPNTALEMVTDCDASVAYVSYPTVKYTSESMCGCSSNDQDGDICVGDTISCSNPSLRPDHVFDNDDVRVAVGMLPHNEKIVVFGLYGIFGNDVFSVEHVASKMNICKSDVLKIKKSAIKNMRKLVGVV
jgi:RNA polymerase primary sigma factor